VVTATVEDLHGNVGTASFSFDIALTEPDMTAPVIAIAEPASTPVSTEVVPIRVTYSDGQSGVDLSSLTINLNSTEITASCDTGATEATCTSPVLAEGSHTVDATVLDVAGNSASDTFTFEVSFTADVTPPVVSIVAPPDRVFNDSTPPIRVEYSDADSGLETSTFDMVVDGASAVANCTIGPAAADCTPDALSVGSHTIEARIADRAGNTGFAAHTVEIFDDLTPPTVTIQAPDPTVVNNDRPLIQATYDDAVSGVDLSSLDVLMDGASILGSCSPGFSSVSCTPSTLSAGSHTVQVQVSDAVGNVGTANLTFDLILDSTAPTVTVTSPSGTVVDDTTPQVTVGFSDSGTGVDTGTLQVLVNDTDITASCSVGNSMATCESVELSAGSHRITARIADQVGNLGEASQSFELVLEEDPPLVTVDSPAAGSTVTTSTPTLGVSYSDAGSGIATASLSVQIDSLDVTGGCTIGVASASCTPPSIGDGEHTVTATISDLLGNVGRASSSFTVSLDLVDADSPSVSIDPVSGSTVTDDTTPLITVSYSDGESGVDPTSVSVSLDGLSLTAQCQITSASASCEPSPLTAGFHTIDASVEDLVGNPATATSTFEVVYSTSDTDGPVLTVAQPAETPVVDEPAPLIEIDFSDVGVGVDPASLSATLDGADLLPGCQVSASSALCQPAPLAVGFHTVAAQMTDLVGNPGTVSSTFEIVLTASDTTLPSIEIVAPSEAIVEEGDVIPVLVEFDDLDSGIDIASLAVGVDGVDLTGTCSVSSIGAECTALSLAPASHMITASVADLVGNVATASFAFQVVADIRPPFLRIVRPEGDQVVGDATPEVLVEFDDTGSGIDETTLQILLDGSDLTAGCQVDSTAGRAVCEPGALTSEEHTLDVQVSDLRGNLATSTLVFSIDLRLELQIESPVSGLLTSDSTVDVSGTVSPEAETVTLHGVAGVISSDSFTLSGVELHEGTNTLTAIARTAGGGVGSATVSVVRDTTAPRVVINSPPDGFVTSSSQILVTGDYIEPASSGSAFSEAAVTVDGVPAEVENRSFVLPDHLLQPGENRIRVEATDAAGNVGSAEVAVTLLSDPIQKVEELLGNGQTGTVGQALAKPLMVRVTDGIGNPLSERLVQFAVSRGDGTVRAGTEEARSLTVRTDDLGRAEVEFILGERSGMGNHEVTVTSVGFPGSLVFCASAEPLAANRIVKIQGNHQTGALFGAVGEELPKPLYTQVFDAMDNPVSGVPVTYEVVTGGGSFGGAPTVTITTDAKGVATAIFTLGPLPGVDVDVVKASIENGTGGPAVFNVTGLEPGPEALTSVSGIVLDNQDDPVPNVTMSIVDTALSTLTDAEGRFHLAGAPVGTVHLKADGTTATRPGNWAVLMFEMVTVSGQDNELGNPVRLLPIHPGVMAGGDADVVIPLEGVPGATLTVFAHSATFPDGSKEGLVSFTQVHSDKVPMVPPLGSNFAVALTIQPTGTLFEPPAQIQIPNPGHKPGEVVDIYGFDHDLGEFVPEGTGTVTPDGQFLRSNPGSGVHKAGWHGCARPVPETDACNPGACSFCALDGPHPVCGQCEVCDPSSSSLVVGVGDDGGPLGLVAAKAANCTAKTVDSVQITSRGKPDRVIVAMDEAVPFSASAKGTCKDLNYEWDFDDGSATESGDSSSTSHTFTDPGVKNVQVTVTCKGCSGAGTATDTIEVVVVEVTVDSLSPSTELILGEDLTVNYTINAPPDVTFDRVELRILNQSDDEIFKTANLPVQSGSQQGTWEKGKWNQSPHVGAFANPNGGDYKVVVAAFKDGSEAKSKDDKTIGTKLVVEATIEDKPPQGSSVSVSAGLRDLSQTLKIVFKNGSSETPFSGGAITVTPQGTDDSVKDIKLDAPGLNTLSDGDYKVLFRDLRDDIGNFSDDDKNGSNGIQPIEFEIKLRSAP